MTLPAGSSPDDAGHQDGEAKASGRALEAPSSGSEVDASLAPFFSAAAEERAEAPGPSRSLYSRVLDYSAHAAMIAGLLGFAWTVSDHVGKPANPGPANFTPVKAAPAPVDETAELRRTNQKMAADITALRASLDALRGAVHGDKTAEQVHQLQANLESVKSGLASTKTETSTTLAQLSSKIDHLPHSEPSAKLQQLAERLDRVERGEIDKTVTSSIPPAAAAAKPAPAIAVPPVKPQAAKAPEPAPEPAKKAGVDKAPAPTEAEVAKKPAVIAEWVVRDVYDGVAVVESKHGPMEVVPGVAIPGAGVVRSIDRRGAGWTVTTSKGQIAYLAPARGREQHGYYRTMPEDF